jgi:hypothetical protein
VLIEIYCGGIFIKNLLYEFSESYHNQIRKTFERKVKYEKQTFEVIKNLKGVTSEEILISIPNQSEEFQLQHSVH